MTSRDYLSGRKPSFDVSGDVVRLALAHTTLWDVQSWSELRYHVSECRIPQSQIEAAGSLSGTFHGQSPPP